MPPGRIGNSIRSIHMSKAISQDNEKRVGMELQKTVGKLRQAREQAIQDMAEAISLAADAGQLLLSARSEGLDVEAVLKVGGINGEEGRRLERVAKSKAMLTNPKPGELKQLCLWAGILPDPIEGSSPRPQAHWLAYVFKAKQWVAKKSPTQWTEAQRLEFVEEAKPLVEAWVEAGGRL
jgi:hypothetical protein